MASARKSVSDVVQVFLSDRCTAHGYPRCRSDSTTGGWFRRSTWFLIAVTFTAYGSWQIFGVVTNYYTNPSITSIEVVQPAALPFPSVTICPVQPIRAITADTYSFIDSTFAAFFPKFGPYKGWDRAAWAPLVDHVSMVDRRFQLFSKLEELLIEKGLTSDEVSLRNLIDELEKKGFDVTSDLDHVAKLQEVFKINNDLAPRDGKTTIWDSENQDLYLNWMNESWNGEFFDIKHYASKLGTLNRTDYFGMLLTRSMENFRLELQSADFYAPNVKLQFENTVLLLSNWLSRFSEGGMKTSIINQADFAERYLFHRILSPYTFSVNDIIFSCTFQGRSCQTKFYTTIDPRWKGCFHFNNEFVHQKNEGTYMFRLNGTQFRQKPRSVNAVGKDGGLTVTLINRVNQSLFNFLNPLDGFVVAIGDSATMPRLDQHIAFPGTGNTDLAIQRTEIIRLDASNGGGCADENHFGIVFPNMTIVGFYDQNICRQLLMHSFTLKECGCIKSSNVLGGIIGIENVMAQYESCGFDSIPCSEYASALASNDSVKICPPACREVKYDVFSSTVTNNERGSLALSMLQSLEAPMRTICSFDGDEACRHPQFATVNIFYRSNSVQMLRESLIYSTNDFVANIGGLAGLYIGISLVSLMEIIEFIFDLIIFRFLNPFRQGKNSVFCKRESKFEGDVEFRLKQLEAKVSRYELLEKEINRLKYLETEIKSIRAEMEKQSWNQSSAFPKNPATI